MIGSIISIGTFIVTILYSYLMIDTMINRNATSLNISETFSNLSSDSDPIYLKDSFQFAVNANDDFGKSILDHPNIASITFEQVIYSLKTGESKRIKIKPVKCTYDMFPNINRTTLDIIRIVDFYCPETYDFILKGNIYDNNFSYIAINIYKCTNTSKSTSPCASNEEISYKMNHSQINLAFVNNYFYGNDYENPIKSYLDDSASDYLIDGFQKVMFGYVKENTVSTQDNIFNYSPNGVESSFLTVEKVNRLLLAQDDFNSIGFIGIYKDAKSTDYQRQVFTLLDCFGNIGGVNELFKTMGELLVVIFSGKIFMFSVLSALYQVDQKVNTDQKIEYKENLLKPNL